MRFLKLIASLFVSSPVNVVVREDAPAPTREESSEVSPTPQKEKSQFLFPATTEKWQREIEKLWEEEERWCKRITEKEEALRKEVSSLSASVQDELRKRQIKKEIESLSGERKRRMPISEKKALLQGKLWEGEMAQGRVVCLTKDDVVGVAPPHIPKETLKFPGERRLVVFEKDGERFFVLFFIEQYPITSYQEWRCGRDYGCGRATTGMWYPPTVLWISQSTAQMRKEELEALVKNGF